MPQAEWLGFRRRERRRGLRGIEVFPPGQDQAVRSSITPTTGSECRPAGVVM